MNRVINEGPVNWGKSTLRKWLNSNFINDAFDKDEQKAICLSVIKNKENIDCYGVEASKDGDTKDRVFILNTKELRRLLKDCDGVNTEYVNGIIPKEDLSFREGKYWARSTTALSENRNDPSAYKKKYYATVYSDYYNQKNDPGGIFDDAFMPVRPAIWLDLNQLSKYLLDHMKN